MHPDVPPPGKSSIFSLEGTAGKDEAGDETQGEGSRGSSKTKRKGRKKQTVGALGTTVRSPTKEVNLDTFYL